MSFLSSKFKDYRDDKSPAKISKINRYCQNEKVHLTKLHFRSLGLQFCRCQNPISHLISEEKIIFPQFCCRTLTMIITFKVFFIFFSAIEAWVIACIIFVFGALGEYTVILLKLKLTKLYPKPRQRRPRRNGRNHNPMGPPTGT